MQSNRIDAFDSLRALAMLLGVLLHGSIAYMVYPLPVWPIRDHSGLWADILVYIIHAFRMPLFFVLAGYFSMLVMQKKGIGGFLRQRIRRILLPFICGVGLLIPLQLLTILFLEYREKLWIQAGHLPSLSFREYMFDSTMIDSMASGFASGYMPFLTDLIMYIKPMHLWFLYDILLFSVLLACANFLLLKLPRLKYWFLLLPLEAFMHPFAIVSLVTSCFWQMRTWSLDSSAGWGLNFPLLLVYASFFCLGIGFYSKPQLQKKYTRSWGRLLSLAHLCILPIALAAASYGLPLELGEKGLPSHLLWVKVIGVFFAALYTVSMVLGVLGLGLRYCDRPCLRLQKWSDASYWIYLCSFLPTLWLQVLFSEVAIPSVLKVVFICLAVSYPLYWIYMKGIHRGKLAKYIGGKASFKAQADQKSQSEESGEVAMV